MRTDYRDYDYSGSSGTLAGDLHASYHILAAIAQAAYDVPSKDNRDAVMRINTHINKLRRELNARTAHDFGRV